LAAFEWYFSFIEIKKFDEKYVVKDTDVLAEIFIHVLTCGEENPNFEITKD
jgi:hypothetical protein